MNKFAFKTFVVFLSLFFLGPVQSVRPSVEPLKPKSPPLSFSSSFFFDLFRLQNYLVYLFVQICIRVFAVVAIVSLQTCISIGRKAVVSLASLGRRQNSTKDLAVSSHNCCDVSHTVGSNGAFMSSVQFRGFRLQPDSTRA